MTKSKLVSYTRISPNTSGRRGQPISKVTVHHMAGNCTVEVCGSIFADPSRQASSNYGVGSDGRVACYLEEEYHPWTSSSYWNDDRAVTIEVADYDTDAWSPSSAAYKSTVALCADICTRYGIKPTYTGGTDGSFTEHMMFASTSCPGPWWHARMKSFVKDVQNAMEDDMATAADVWGYNWNKTAPGGNMYNCMVAMSNNVNSIVEKLDEIEKRLDNLEVGDVTVDVDYSKMAKAVNDDAAKRLAD